MGKIVATEVILLGRGEEDQGGGGAFAHGGWTFEIDRGAEGDQFKLGELEEAEAQLLGRVTYEGFAAAWPTMEDDGVGFRDKMNSMPKYVVSSTLTDPSWENSSVISLDDVAGLDGTLLVAGSASLAQGLHARGLVDEYRLMVFPVVLGSGKRLWSSSESELAAFTLARHQVLGSGTLILSYARA